MAASTHILSHGNALSPSHMNTNIEYSFPVAATASHTSQYYNNSIMVYKCGYDCTAAVCLLNACQPNNIDF